MMDTSDVFVKMCDCFEIQGQWAILMDLMAHPTNDPHDYSAYLVRKSKEMVCLWLPRQDQIQEMMGVGSLQQMECIIMEFTEWHNEEYMYSFDSLEKQWLAFYMWEKHKKIWDSKQEKWKKSE